MTWLRGLRPARLAAQVARVVAVVALLLTISAVGSSPSVHARAHLVGANPPDGAMLTEPPQAVTLTFAEPVDAAQSIITVHDPISRPASIQPRPHISDTNTLEMPIVATEPGRYQTHYMVTAADGHAVTGILTFTLTATPSEAGAAEPPDETNPALGNDSWPAWAWLAASLATLTAAAVTALAIRLHQRGRHQLRRRDQPTHEPGRRDVS